MDPRTERMLAERRAAEDALAALPRGRRLHVQAAGMLKRNRRGLLAVAAIVLAAVAVHYALITLPARARERRVEATREAGRQQAQHRLDHGLKLDSCFAAAKSAFVASWDGSCRALKRRESCTLPSDQAQAHETLLLHAREECFKRFSGN
jgi:hypothetical protein